MKDEDCEPAASLMKVRLFHAKAYISHLASAHVLLDITISSHRLFE